MSANRITLHKGKEVSIKRFHPWVFSGAIHKMPENLEDGSLVEVYSSKQEFLGIGHYNNGSIAVRIVRFDLPDLSQDYWTSKFKEAYHFRKQLGLVKEDKQNVYRLIFAEGDGFPGLIIDIYGVVAVVQCHSLGMYKELEKIKVALVETLGSSLEGIYNKSIETLPVKNEEIKDGYIWGNYDQSCVVSENGNLFYIDWVEGQKTGFFIDQRDNRELLARYSKGKDVLNTFCYTGGFSIYALNAGANFVHSVDSSQKAIDLTIRNAELNNVSDRHKASKEDVFVCLKEIENLYDIIILDPPAFAKNKKARHNALMAYKRINVEAFKKIKKGGFLFTFSCSQVVDKYLFANTITAAAIEAGREIRLIHQLTQPADHPINVFHPEGEYLKGLVFYVE